MRRREFVTLIGAAATYASRPLAARAQQPAMPGLEEPAKLLALADEVIE